MPSIGLFFFFLGLVVASVTANETSTYSSTVNYSPTATPLNVSTDVTGTTSANNVTANGTMNNTEAMNNTEGSSTIVPFTTMQGGASSKSAAPVTTTKSKEQSKRTTAKTIKDKSTTAKPHDDPAVDSTGIIIIVVIIFVSLGFALACFFGRKRGRRYSVDFVSRPDDVNIPLSTVEPELPIDAVPRNGLQTFESTEKELQEPEAKPEVQEEQTAEADKAAVDPSAESAAPEPTPDSNEDKPNEDKPKEDVVEQSPPAPVEEKTDDEGVVSNKISVESLKEANENNSNNVDFSQTRDMKRIVNFWDVPLNCPVRDISPICEGAVLQELD